ncbi:MAG: hypothetical protein Kow00114_27140 [Kiloniellaceae bacterium]
MRSVKEEIDIERLLVWTYHNKAAHKVTARITTRLAPAGFVSNAHGVLRMAALGCRIDNLAGAGFAGAGDLDPDAEAVHEAVLALPVSEGALVLQHALSGTRPDWLPGAAARMRPVLRGNGRPEMVYWDPPKCRKPAYCRVTADPSQSSIDFARGLYRCWWGALFRLAGTLRLRQFMVTGPAVLQEPWTEGD